MDSDGYFTCGHTYGLRKNGLPWNHWYFRAGVHQVEPHAVNWLHVTFGGRLCTRPPSSKLSTRSMLTWDLTGPLLVKFIEAIRPFLKIKGQQADTVLAFYKDFKDARRLKGGDLVGEIDRRSRLHLQLRALNRAS